MFCLNWKSNACTCCASSHNVTADLDSGSITRYTEGISNVYEVVQALYRGLRKIVLDSAEEK
jgi:hypothetical protein